MLKCEQECVSFLGSVQLVRIFKVQPIDLTDEHSLPTLQQIYFP